MRTHVVRAPGGVRLQPVAPLCGARFLSARVPFEHEILSVKGKYITIENADALSVLAGTPRINVTVNA